MKIVGTAIITKENKILIAQRPEGKSLAGLWEFAGGKLEENETIEQCLKREIFEELNVQIKIGDFLMDSHYKYEHGEFLLKVYFATIIDIENFKLNVHQDYKWVTKEELNNYPFPPADIAIIKKLIS
ncbi:MAG: (deoxy)nucleoside triphosphate pyrophosphohydrolase [Alphaproteobacteria bacterium]